jgi:hypothetical protein
VVRAASLGNSAAIGPFTDMIAVAITPAAYNAFKATLPRMDGAASPGADGHVRIWLDCKVVGELGRLRGLAESYSDVILRVARTGSQWRLAREG